MTIRSATLADVPQLSGLLSEFFAYNAGQQPGHCIAARDDGQYPSSVINRAAGDFIVAELNNMLVGFIHIEEEKTPTYPSVAPHKFACVVDFYVKQHHRRRNIGHMLLEEAKRWVQSRNLDYIELMVLENNEIGKSFYARERFFTMSRTMRFYFE